MTKFDSKQAIIQKDIHLIQIFQEKLNWMARSRGMIAWCPKGTW